MPCQLLEHQKLVRVRSCQTVRGQTQDGLEQTSFGTITPRVDAFFSGEVQFLPDNFPTSTQKAYHQTNLRLTWTSPDNRYKVEGFVNNVENEDVISNDGLQSISLGQQLIEPDNFVYFPPRTYGVRFAVNFGG